MTTTICNYSDADLERLSKCYSKIGFDCLALVNESVRDVGGVPLHTLAVIENMVVASIYTLDLPNQGATSQEQLYGIYKAASKRLSDLRLFDMAVEGEA